MEVVMTQIALRYTFAVLVIATLVSAVASGPVSASGAILVVTAADDPIPKTSNGSKQAKPHPEFSYVVPMEAPTMTQAKKKERPVQFSK
jgi:hypothetical protein